MLCNFEKYMHSGKKKKKTNKQTWNTKGRLESGKIKNKPTTVAKFTRMRINNQNRTLRSLPLKQTLNNQNKINQWTNGNFTKRSSIMNENKFYKNGSKQTKLILQKKKKPRIKEVEKEHLQRKAWKRFLCNKWEGLEEGGRTVIS